MKMKIPKLLIALVAMTAVVVIQTPNAQCAGWSVDKNGVRLSCDVPDQNVTTNLWGEWLKFKAGISAMRTEGGGSASWSWECQRSGLSTAYNCAPSATQIYIPGGSRDAPNVPLMIVEVAINPGDTCAGCTACKQLLNNVSIK